MAVPHDFRPISEKTVDELEGEVVELLRAHLARKK